RSRRRAGRPAGAGVRVFCEGPGSGQGDRAGTGSGQRKWAKMSSAGGVLAAGDVGVRTSIVPPGPRQPPAEPPDSPPAATTSQVTALIHDFAVSLGCRPLRPEANAMWPTTTLTPSDLPRSV